MQTTSQGFKYVEPADAIADFPAPDQSNWKLVEARTPRRVTSAQMSALTGLVDGQEIELEVDAAAGIYWRLRFRAASASPYKWEFVGGPPFSAGYAPGYAAGQGAYADAPGPVGLTLPRAGDYLFQFGHTAYASSAGQVIYLAVKRGAAATVDGDGFRINSPAANQFGGGSLARLFAACAAGDLYKLQAKIGAGGSALESTWLTITPYRVS